MIIVFQDPIDKWSCCSNSDFANLYNGLGTFCLSAHDGTGPNITTPTPTTTLPPPTGCYNQTWYADSFCDDENNNADCNWDGGDCCNNSMNGWDDYCIVCQCLDPSENPPPPVCGGIVSESSGTIQSPGWPENYPAGDFFCNWSIVCDGGKANYEVNWGDLTVEGSWGENVDANCR